MSRHTAREVALHMIYELTFKAAKHGELLSQRLSQEEFEHFAADSETYTQKLTDKDREYIVRVVAGVSESREELDGELAKFSVDWKTSRLSRLTGSILRLALYEIKYIEDVPAGAAINEAVELAKLYDTDEAPSFINGLLGTLCREMKY